MRALTVLFGIVCVAVVAAIITMNRKADDALDEHVARKMRALERTQQMITELIVDPTESYGSEFDDLFIRFMQARDKDQGALVVSEMVDLVEADRKYW